jgi:hypothetical protein
MIKNWFIVSLGQPPHIQPPNTVLVITY